MHPLDSVPSVRRLETDRKDLLAIEIAGPLGGADVENLYGLLEGAYTLHDTLDLLVRATDEDVKWSEIDASTLENGRDHARSHIRRCATIGGSSEMNSLIKTFGKTSQTEFRRFEPDDEPQAWEWLAARELPANI